MSSGDEAVYFGVYGSDDLFPQAQRSGIETSAVLQVPELTSGSSLIYLLLGDADKQNANIGGKLSIETSDDQVSWVLSGGFTWKGRADFDVSRTPTIVVDLRPGKGRFFRAVLELQNDVSIGVRVTY